MSALFLFDPDDVDLSNDREYLALAARIAPTNGTEWAYDEAAIAKRAEMLEIDREMFTAWMRAMEKLLVQEFTDAEFTAQRMMRLKLWTKERKRRQHNLHYKYDPGRRNPRLVERDSKRQLEQTRSRLKAAQERFWARYPEHAPEGWEAPADDPPAAPQPPRKTIAAPAPRIVRPSSQLRDEAFIPAPGEEPAEPASRPAPAVEPPFIPDYLAPTTFQMIVKDTGLSDPARATDDEVLAAYEKAGMTGYPAEYFLATLRGRTLPPHPDEA